MTKKKRSEMYEVFAEVFHDVVVPILEDLNDKIENTSTKEDIDRLERRHFSNQNRMDRHGMTIEKHEKDIKQIKTKLNLV